MPSTLPQPLQDYARAVVGGLLFGLPLLYTMEMWWTGFLAGPLRMLVALGVTFGLLLGYNRYAGLHEDASFAEAAWESIEELGLGLLLAAGMLWLLGRFPAGIHWREVVGKVTVEAMAVAIGISVGKAQLGSPSGDQKDQDDAGRSNVDKTPLASHLLIGLCGAVLIALNVAPTEEVLQIAAESSPAKLLGIATFSLLLGGAALYFSDFVGSEAAENNWHIVGGTAFMYAVALGASAFLLWFFGRFSGASFELALALTVVLGLPSALGASAGRLLLNL